MMSLKTKGIILFIVGAVLFLFFPADARRVRAHTSIEELRQELAEAGINSEHIELILNGELTTETIHLIEGLKKGRLVGHVTRRNNIPYYSLRPKQYGFECYRTYLTSSARYLAHPSIPFSEGQITFKTSIIVFNKRTLVRKLRREPGVTPELYERSGHWDLMVTGVRIDYYIAAEGHKEAEDYGYLGWYNVGQYWLYEELERCGLLDRYKAYVNLIQ